MKNLEKRVLKQFPFSQVHLFKKIKKGGEEAKENGSYKKRV